MTPHADLDEIRRTVEEDLAKGDTAGTKVGWKTRHAQLANNLALLRVEGLTSGARVLDVGCGLGSLLETLRASGLDVDYTGVDFSPRMLEEARARHPTARFLQHDLLSAPLGETFDHVFCSGALNYLVVDHERYLGRMIQTMWGLCTRALSFNLLSAHETARSPGLQRTPGRYFYAWPETVLRFCLSLTPLVSLDHASRASSFTVHAYRQNPAAVDRYLAVQPLRDGDEEGTRAAIDYHQELGLGEAADALLAGLPPSAEQQVQLGHGRVRRGDLARAEAAYRRALELEPGSVRSRVSLALLLFHARRFDEAADTLASALDLEPANVPTLETLIEVELARGRREAATALAERLPQGSGRAHFLGLSAGDDERAEQHFREAVSEAPGWIIPRARLAMLLEKRGQWEEAARHWRHAAEVAPQEPGLLQRAELARRRAAERAQP